MIVRSAAVALVAGCAAILTLTVLNREIAAPLGPKTHLEVGISPGASILDASEEELQASLDLLGDLGVTGIRVDLDWSRIEASQGQFNWDRTDAIAREAAERGIHVHALITYTPRWARPEGRSDKAPPIDPDELARFAGHAVRRYQPLGITSWEVWNEPNSSNFWDSPTGPDPALYAELFRVTARAIKDVDDGATVITGGLAPAVDRPMLELSPVRFLDEMYDSLEPGLVDGIGVHPYSYPALPLGGQRWNQFSSRPDLQKLVEEREGEPVQLWITEFGAPTGEADNAVDAERQAKIVSDALHCASSVPWIGPVFIYNLHDRPGGQPEDVEDNFGLVTAEGAWKPAADIVQAFQQEADGAPVPDPCHDW